MNRSLLVKGQGGHYGAQTWRGAARRAQPPPHRPPSRPPLPPLSPFPPNTPPRRHWLAGRANGGAVAGQGRAGPHVARGSRRARGNRSRRRARPVHVSGPCPCVRVPSVCPAVSARPHPSAPATRTGRYAAVPAPWPRGRLRAPKPRGFASESARPLPPGGRGRAWGREGGDSDVSECCGMQPCPGGLQQAGG